VQTIRGGRMQKISMGWTKEGGEENISVREKKKNSGYVYGKSGWEHGADHIVYPDFNTQMQE